MNELYIGVMSGTSMDGIDVALCEIDPRSCRLIYANEYPFPRAFKEEILSDISGVLRLEDIGQLDTKLGHLFADAIEKFILDNQINRDAIKAIGLHGQTLWHAPDDASPFSMQLGSPSVVSAKTKLSVVADFRNMDIANGGQGAPFAPAFHAFAFQNLAKNTAVVNIGGMANITLLGEKILGWDTGPGNALMDMWIAKCKNEGYDKDGAFAKSGTPNQELLEKLLSDNYFKKPPPKSTGREYFNESWLASHLPLFNTIKEEDIQATLLELTARTIAHDAAKCELLIICGGGVKNSFLMQRLQELSTFKVAPSDDYGINADALEAMAFAWLSYKRVHREEVDLKDVTGAHKNSILGGIYG